MKHKIIHIVLAFVLGVLSTLVVAYLFGPKKEEMLRDPITNRVMYRSSWLSINLTQKIETNEVSNWVDQNLPDTMYQGQYGWLSRWLV